MTVIDTKNKVSYPYLTADQVADIIGVNRSTVYRWCKRSDKETFNNFEVWFTECEYFCNRIATT